MKSITTILILSIFLSIVSCKQESKKQSSPVPVIKSILIDTPRSFVKNYGVNDNNPMFAFVGEKIWVQPIPSRMHSMDNSYRARYVILQKIFGEFSGDTIEFVVYDHYGRPAFSEYKNPLLFVGADSGTYFHHKYMFNDVYKTKNGRWAGTYANNDYDHEYLKHTKIKPVRIDFAEPVIYPIKRFDDEGRPMIFSYTKPYFKIVGDSAYAVYGNYVEDLFILKRDSYLTARKIFKNGKLNKVE